MVLERVDLEVSKKLVIIFQALYCVSTSRMLSDTQTVKVVKFQLEGFIFKFCNGLLHIVRSCTRTVLLACAGKVV